jgi:hypothetical protein
MVVSAATARAADITTAPPPVPLPQDARWSLTIAPYFWMAGLKGDVGLFGREPVALDQSFGDILDDLKFGGMTVMELNNGTWGLFGDLMYIRTKSDTSVSRSVLGVPTRLSASVDTSSFTGTLMGEYRVYSEPIATIDLMAGARIWDVNNDIDIGLTAGGPPLAEFSGSDGDTWVDPMVGAKGRYNIDDSWYLTGWGMIGGFGAGSKFTWDVMGSVGYRYSDRLSFTVGYRALGVDYDNDGFVYDVVEHGPVLGTILRF